LQVELARVDSEIEKLVGSLTGANSVLLSYVNVKIAELDGRKQALVKEIAELTVETISPEQVKQISGYLDTWDERELRRQTAGAGFAGCHRGGHQRQAKHYMENLTGRIPVRP
jgi:uncharacterized protein YcbK (DUF882 family)